MEPMENLEALKKKLDQNALERESLLLERDPIILEARKAQHTWREIALALGMTEHGVIKASKRTK